MNIYEIICIIVAFALVVNQVYRHFEHQAWFDAFIEDTATHAGPEWLAANYGIVPMRLQIRRWQNAKGHGCPCGYYRGGVTAPNLSMS